MKTRTLGLLASLLAAGSLTAGDVVPADTPVAYTTAPQSEWEFDFLLYGWAAGLNGAVGVNGVTSSVDIDFSAPVS